MRISGTILTLCAMLATSATAQINTQLISWDGQPPGWDMESGTEGIGESTFLSSNGLYAAFITAAGNVFENGEDQVQDLPVIVLRNNQTGELTTVSVAYDGSLPNGPSFGPTVTTDGRYVSFCSWASNLVANDNNGQGDIFVRDMQTNVTKRVNVPYDGVWDTYDKTYCLTHAMSDDGRYIVFVTASNHQVPGDNNDSDDVFLRDMVTNTTYLVSTATTGGPGNASSLEPRIARNGRYVVFMSMASNLVAGTTTNTLRTYRRDTNPSAPSTVLVGEGGLPHISADGRYVVYSSIYTGSAFAHVYRFDAQTGQRVLCSVASDGTTPGNRDSLGPYVSDNGRYVCFTSKARNLITGDTNDEADVFMRDLGATPPVTTRVSVGVDGLQGNRASGNAAMSADGRWIVFTSASEDLVTLDMNENPDVFLRGPMFASTFGMSDAMNAVRIAAGRSASTSVDLALDVVKTGTSQGRIDILDAARITRAVAGLN